MSAKKGYAALWVSIIAIIAIAGFVFYKSRKHKKGDAGNTAPNTLTPEGKPKNPSTPSTPSTPPTVRADGYSFPFKTPDQGNVFREWIWKNYPDYAKQIQLDKKGTLNEYLDKAWKKYGKEFASTPTGLPQLGSFLPQLI